MSPHDDAPADPTDTSAQGLPGRESQDEADDPVEVAAHEESTGATEHSSQRQRRLRRRANREREDRDREDRMAARLAAQWAMLREERDRRTAGGAGESIPTGPSNLTRAQVPWGLDLAASWAWRLIVIGAAGYVLFRLIGYFSIVTLPLAIALLIAALVTPVVQGLQRIGFPR